MRLTILAFVILISLTKSYSQETKLITKKSKNPHATEKYYVLKNNKNKKQGPYEKRLYNDRLSIRGYYKNNKKDSIWINFSYNGIDTSSIGKYSDDERIGVWKIYDYQGRVRYKYDYDKDDVIEYNWYETPNTFLINSDGVWVEREIDSPPLIIGIENPLQSIIYKLSYPVRAQENGISGKVIISFIVDQDGNVSDFKVKKGVDKDLDAEALRAVKLIDKKIKPAKINGKAVTVEYHLPVVFQLN
jgi:TonB family protein